MSAIETLKKIEYNSLEQFKADLNYNFAILQNSPLFKGIPGNLGLPGVGIRGIRGIKFLFVNLQKFQEQFPGELNNSTQVNIDYINTKLLTFENKNKLLLAFDVTEFVDKDIIVITNSMMFSYSLELNKIITTGIAFNEQTNLLSNINQQIESQIQYYLSINQSLNNITNVFESYSTLAKNYADTNNTFVTNNLTDSSIYSPFIPGYNSNIGIPINNHKYFGFSDVQYPLNNKGTTVFGNMKRYYQLLMNTISTDTNQTLTSDYSPGIDNIPQLVILQDTEKAGLLIGYKSRQNLKRFGSIFKNDLHELILKSDSGKNPSEYSELKLHRNYLKYDKLVQFDNDLEVSRDFKSFADISNKFFKSGKFTEGAEEENNFNPNIFEFGRVSDETIINTEVKHVSDIESYKNYLSNVLITDETGKLSKEFSLEKSLLDNSLLINLTNISELINSDKKILTSNYYNYLAKKINNSNNFITGNYWKKDQFETGIIPSLNLSKDLTVIKNTNLANMIRVLIEEEKVFLGGNTLQTITTPNIKYDYFSNKVLITDATGKLSNQYILETNPLDLAELTFGTPLNILNGSDKNILSTKYYTHLAKKINGLDGGLANNYWNKIEFETGIIPFLKLSNGLFVNGGYTHVANNNVIINVNPVTGEIKLGSENTQITFESNNINYKKFIKRILVTDKFGNLSKTYFIEDNLFNDNDLPGNNNITIIEPTENNIFGVARGSQIRWITNKINNLTTWLTQNVWYKNQFTTGIIPNLLTNLFLGTNGDFRVGNIDNPNISTLNNETKIGKVQGLLKLIGNTIKFENRPNKVIVTDNNGDVLDTYSIETIWPNSGPGTGSFEDASIEADYWVKENLQNQPFLDYPTLQTKIVNSKYIGWMVSHLKSIRKLLYDRPTFSEASNLFSINSPNGIIVYWNEVFGPIPTGWIVCDGRYIPGLNVRTPYLVGKYIKSSLTPNIVTGSNTIVIGVDNLPAHNHNIQPHSHQYNFQGSNSGVGNVGSNIITSSVNPNGTQIKNTASNNSQYTDNTGSNLPINIEPNNITMIPIMKYWNGSGVLPIIDLPPFSIINSIEQEPNNNSVKMNITYIDTSVNIAVIQASNDNGITWISVKDISIQTNMVLNINLPSNGLWLFRIKALAGDSAFTNGQYSLSVSFEIITPWASLNPTKIIKISETEVSMKFNQIDMSVTELTLQRSTNNIDFVDVLTQTILSNILLDTLTEINVTYYYRLKANNGISINKFSNIVAFSNIELLFPIVINNMTMLFNNSSNKTTINAAITIIDTSLTQVVLEYFDSEFWTIVNSIPIQINAFTTNISVNVSGNLNITRNYRIRTLNANSGYLINSNIYNYTN